MTTLLIYQRGRIFDPLPDGDPCDRCPRELGRGGRRVLWGSQRMRVCYSCLVELRKQATSIIKER